MADELKDPTPGAEPGKPEQGTPNFDELLKNPAFQAEFDRRVTKSIKTVQDKAATEKTTVEELKKQLDTQNATLADYMNREAVIKAGIDPRYLKFVAFEVKQGAADGTDFGTALDAYVKANPQYMAQAPTPPPQAWGAPQSGSGANAPSGVEAAFTKLNPNLKLE